jgi:hypothetical protein
MLFFSASHSASQLATNQFIVVKIASLSVIRYPSASARSSRKLSDQVFLGALGTANGNTFQASSEGGDGNDLTLTVVP